MSVVNREFFNVQRDDGSTEDVIAQHYTITRCGALLFNNYEFGKFVLVKAFADTAWQTIVRVREEDIQDRRTLGKLP